jgi:hypothetical protein
LEELDFSVSRNLGIGVALLWRSHSFLCTTSLF